MAEVFRVLAVSTRLNVDCHERIVEMEVSDSGDMKWRFSQQEAVSILKNDGIMYLKIDDRIFGLEVGTSNGFEYLKSKNIEQEPDPLFSLPVLLNNHLM